MMRINIPKPVTGTDFEDFCYQIIGLFWPGASIQFFGRNGQKQHGLDIIITQVDKIIGFQCKNISNFSVNTISTEIRNTNTLDFKIDEFIFLTTSSRDQKIQSFIINKNSEITRKNNLKIIFWEDMVSKLQENGTALKNYLLKVGIPITPTPKERDIRTLKSILSHISLNTLSLSIDKAPKYVNEYFGDFIPYIDQNIFIPSFKIFDKELNSAFMDVMQLWCHISNQMVPYYDLLKDSEVLILDTTNTKDNSNYQFFINLFSQLQLNINKLTGLIHENYSNEIDLPILDLKAVNWYKDFCKRIDDRFKEYK